MPMPAVWITVLQGGILAMMGAFTTEHWLGKWGNARCRQPAATEQKDGRDKPKRWGERKTSPRLRPRRRRMYAQPRRLLYKCDPQI